jgi:hypothetical protein
MEWQRLELRRIVKISSLSKPAVAEVVGTFDKPGTGIGLDLNAVDDVHLGRFTPIGVPKIISRKQAISATGFATLMGIGALVAAAAPASAYVACNHEGGDCWHTDKKVRAPGVSLDYHPDDWYFHQKWEGDNTRHYRDYHEGRGYYRNGIWIQL